MRVQRKELILSEEETRNESGETLINFSKQKGMFYETRGDN